VADDNQKSVTDPVAGLLARSGLEPGRPPPPVERWNPPHCGEIDLRIARDGTWFYLGTPIGRLPLVRLFASILRRDGADYVLVTPVEKVSIRVDDAPFLAVDFEVTGSGPGQVVTFITSLGDSAAGGPDHPIRVTRDPASGEPAPYVMIRRGLEALIDRKSFYRLSDIAVHETRGGESWLGLWSGGVFFPFIRSAELPDEGAG
jgi:hypothetical protein